MKLSKKIVAIIVAAMTLTSIPVIAASNNSVVNGNAVYELNTKTVAPAISIEFLDNAGDDEEFFLELTGGEWLNDSDPRDKFVIESKFNVTSPDTWESKDGKYTLTRQDEKVVKVNVAGDVIQASKKITFNLPVKLTEKETSVAIVANGGSTVTAGKVGVKVNVAGDVIQASKKITFNLPVKLTEKETSVAIVANGGSTVTAGKVGGSSEVTPSVSPSPSVSPVPTVAPTATAVPEASKAPIEQVNDSKTKALTVKFTIGKSIYTSNGIEVSMDAAPYVKNPGYTMVPIRYAFVAFGINDIKAEKADGKSIIKVTDGEKEIMLTVGERSALVNGKKVALSVAPEIVGDRTYAPVGEIAKILGVNSYWDASSKTATFTRGPLKIEPTLPVETPAVK